jgi:hypothetical protein
MFLCLRWWYVCAVTAPTGCLMYYTGTQGTVKSFNYNPSSRATGKWRITSCNIQHWQLHILITNSEECWVNFCVTNNRDHSNLVLQVTFIPLSTLWERQGRSSYLLCQNRCPVQYITQVVSTWWYSSGCSSDSSHPCSNWIKYVWSFPSIMWIVRCLIRHKDSFIFNEVGQKEKRERNVTEHDLQYHKWTCQTCHLHNLFSPYKCGVQHHVSWYHGPEFLN